MHSSTQSMWELQDHVVYCPANPGVEPVTHWVMLAMCPPLQAEIMNGRWALLGALGCLVPEYLVRNNVSAELPGMTRCPFGCTIPSTERPLIMCMLCHTGC